MNPAVLSEDRILLQLKVHPFFRFLLYLATNSI